MNNLEMVYDIAGIGIGPFNLGMAALSNQVPQLKCVFFDAKPSFEWHGGLLLKEAQLQVPFYADMVTSADPTSPLSFLAYLKQVKRMYQFAILEELYVSRVEYNRYCQWVASQLTTLRFGHTVYDITYSEPENYYLLEVREGETTHLYRAKHLVVGIGSVPWIPPYIDRNEKGILHSSEYLHYKDDIRKAQRVSIIGSGQSAAEIFYDLLEDGQAAYQHLNWLTKAARFHPMEASKFTLEMTSPDYIRHFYRLTPEQKQVTLKGQQYLYKGINQDLIAAIYHSLYHQDKSERFLIAPNCELAYIQPGQDNYELQLRHVETGNAFQVHSDIIILATGYQPATAPFLQSIENRIVYDSTGAYQIRSNYAIDKTGKEIFVQNAELHTHGFNAPDLGMGPYRNSIILNSILGYERFKVDERIAFQTFNPD